MHLFTRQLASNEQSLSNLQAQFDKMQVQEPKANQMSLDYIMLSGGDTEQPEISGPASDSFEGQETDLRSSVESVASVNSEDVAKKNGDEISKECKDELKVVQTFPEAWNNLQLAVRAAVDFDDERDRGATAPVVNCLAEVFLAHTLPEDVEQFHDATLLRKEAVDQAALALKGISWNGKKDRIEAEQDVMNIIHTKLNDNIAQMFKTYAIAYVSKVITTQGNVADFLEMPTIKIEELMVFLVKSVCPEVNVTESGWYRRARALMISILADCCYKYGRPQYLHEELILILHDFEQTHAKLKEDICSYEANEVSLLDMCSMDQLSRAITALKTVLSPYGSFLRDTCQHAMAIVKDAAAVSTPLCERILDSPCLASAKSANDAHGWASNTEWKIGTPAMSAPATTVHAKPRTWADLLGEQKKAPSWGQSIQQGCFGTDGYGNSWGSADGWDAYAVDNGDMNGNEYDNEEGMSADEEDRNYTDYSTGW